MSDEFFVGYLPTPAAHARFVRRAALVLVITVAGLGLLIAARQRDPGDAVWNLEQLGMHTGTVQFLPYPLLRLDDGQNLLVVNEGKVSADASLRSFADQRVMLKGSLLSRPGRAMLELLEPPVAAAGHPSAPPPTLGHESVTLHGEIIDPKCFLGAMKPGDGKTHKACATLCLKGGIPPMFVERGTDGTLRYQLLVGPGGAALAGDTLAAVLPFVGDDITITGTRYRRGDLDFIEIQPGAIRRRKF